MVPSAASGTSAALGADRRLDCSWPDVADLGRQLCLKPPCGVVVAEGLQDDRPF
jgi:hypothetical protein